MAITITGLTAEKMLEMEAATVTGGYIDGAGHLILTTVDATTIDAGSVIGPEGPIGPPVADGAITTAKLADDAVTVAKLADNSVTSQHYVDGSIGRIHIVNDAIDGTKIADNAINSEHYVDGSIDSVHVGFIKVQSGTPSGVTGGIWFET